MALTAALHDLASNPQCIEPLREEIEGITSQQGWSKESVGQMLKLESFLKESQRFWGLGAVVTGRTALKDFTSSNGQTVPAGCTVYFLSRPPHFDKAYYDKPQEFQPFRFFHMGQEEGHSVSHKITTPGTSWLTFGLGRHVCPGRFFASIALKETMAHILLTYDIKLKNETDRLKNKFSGPIRVPDTECKLLWRKRRSEHEMFDWD